MAERVVHLIDAARPDQPPLVYLCGVCCRDFRDTLDAAACCVCGACGRRAEGSEDGLRGTTECRACMTARRSRDRAARLAREMAELLAVPRPLPEAEHRGMVYWPEELGPGDGWFADCDHVRDWCLAHSCEPPARVLAGVEVWPRMDAADAWDQATGDLHDSVRESVSVADIVALQGAMDAWLEAAGPPPSYEPGEQVVELDATKWAALVAKHRPSAGGGGVP